MNKGHTEKIFEIIKDIGYLLPGFETKHEYIKRLRRATYYGTIDRLERRGLVKKEKVRNQVKVLITEKGKAFSFGIKRLHLEKRKDGLSTIIIFDVPEQYKRERQYFRRKLVQNKFTLIQKSVLISGYAYPSQLRQLEKDLKIDKWIRHMAGRIEYVS
jgi:DNA-binding transcriptional regulator PaaX